MAWNKDGLYIGLCQIPYAYTEGLKEVAEPYIWHKGIDPEPVIKIEAIESLILRELYTKGK